MRPIDADALLQRLDEIGIYDWDIVENTIRSQTELDVKPVRHAHWKAKYNPEELSSDTPCKCSNCGEEEPISFISDWNFCPHCGAKMDYAVCDADDNASC